MVKVAAIRKKTGGALAGRLGVKNAGSSITDARQRIIASNQSKIGDARDKLAQMAKSTDARSKLERIRGMKDGNLEVKQVGGITVTKKIDGKLSLSTKSRSESSSSGMSRSAEKVTHIGRLTKTVSSSGQVVLSSKSARSQAGSEGGTGLRSGVGSISGTTRLRSSSAGAASVLRGASSRGEKENVRRGLRDIDSLDDELMTARVDPLLLKKTVENSRNRSSGHLSHRGERDRSPLRSKSPTMTRQDRRRGFDYDDPRALAVREDEILRSRSQAQADPHIAAEMTRAGAPQGISPLQGTKVVIQNLQTSVTQEDIVELFGDIGALKKAKMVSPGHAEVVFVNRVDAKKAVEIYHNRQLDGKPMRCQIVGVNNPVNPGGATMKLPASLTKRRDPEEYRPPIEIETIHKALFFNKKNVGKKPLFTITMPKKGKEEDRW